MTTAEKIIRVIAASLAAFLGAVFVAMYNGGQYHNNVVHKGLSCLPNLTLWVIELWGWAFVIPLLVLVLGILFRKGDIVVTIITSAAWLFALGWPLCCIVAWECPFIIL